MLHLLPTWLSLTTANWIMTHAKNIIFINRFFYPDHSATSQLLTDLAFHLAKQGHVVSVICSHQIYDNSADLFLQYEVKSGVNIYRIKTSNFGRHWLPGRVFDYASYFIGMSWRLFRLLKAGDIVVTKTDPPLTSIFTVCIAKMKRAININWVQDLFPEVAVAVGFKGIPPFVLKLLQYLRNCSFRLSYKTVVIGRLMKQKLLVAGIGENSIEMIPNWSDEKNVAPVSRDLNPLRKRWGLGNKFIIGYSGNMGRVHEFDTIIDAASRISLNQDICFIFIGDGPQKKHIKEKVDKLALPNVLFFPYQAYDDLRQSLSLPDIHLISMKPGVEGFCVPSKYYGIIASGRPTLFIGDKNGEVPSVLREDETGIQIDVGEDSALAEKIVLLYHNRSDLGRWGENARRSFLNKYEKKIALSRWDSVIF